MKKIANSTLWCMVMVSMIFSFIQLEKASQSLVVENYIHAKVKSYQVRFDNPEAIVLNRDAFVKDIENLSDTLDFNVYLKSYLDNRFNIFLKTSDVEYINNLPIRMASNMNQEVFIYSNTSSTNNAIYGLFPEMDITLSSLTEVSDPAFDVMGGWTITISNDKDIQQVVSAFETSLSDYKVSLQPMTQHNNGFRFVINYESMFLLVAILLITLVTCNGILKNAKEIMIMRSEGYSSIKVASSLLLNPLFKGFPLILASLIIVVSIYLQPYGNILYTWMSFFFKFAFIIIVSVIMLSTIMVHIVYHFNHSTSIKGKVSLHFLNYCVFVIKVILLAISVLSVSSMTDNFTKANTLSAKPTLPMTKNIKTFIK